jgi:hypothetical protein
MLINSLQATKKTTNRRWTWKTSYSHMCPLTLAKNKGATSMECRPRTCLNRERQVIAWLISSMIGEGPLPPRPGSNSSMLILIAIHSVAFIKYITFSVGMHSISFHCTYIKYVHKIPISIFPAKQVCLSMPVVPAVWRNCNIQATIKVFQQNK